MAKEDKTNPDVEDVQVPEGDASETSAGEETTGEDVSDDDFYSNLIEEEDFSKFDEDQEEGEVTASDDTAEVEEGESKDLASQETPEKAEKEEQPETPTEPQTKTEDKPTDQVQPPQSAEQEQPSVTPEDLNAQMEQFFQKGVDVLAENVYRFDEETAEQLDSNPSKVLPGLAARLHMQVLTAAVTQVANMLPQMMEIQNERKSEVQQREEKFFNEYPQLKEHKDLVTNIAKVYRQMNPNASFEQAAPEVAAMAMVQARIPVGQPQPPEEAQPSPVTPTSARGATPATRRPEEKSLWEELIEEE